MVAPAALSLGSSCAAALVGLPSSHSDRSCCFPKLPATADCCSRRRRSVVSDGDVLQVARSRTPIHLTRAVAVDSDQLGSSQPPQEEKPTKVTYHFVVANAKFMLDEEEHFKEQLYERLRYFGERGREQDFWLVVEPKFLDKFPTITKRLKRPAVALVSTDATWMRFMKLRLDRVLVGNFEANSLEEALDSNPVDLHFEKPENWTAPYPKYEFGWWEPFLPPGSSKTKA